MKRAVVLMAGGAGTRLRPLSSDEKPKQFLELFDGRSLLQLTFQRATRLVEPEGIFVSTNDQYAALCREQLPLLPRANIIAEPARRNTGPAVALCTFEIEANLGPATVTFLHSDHHIGRADEFIRVMRRAAQYAAQHDELMTIAIRPTEPNTGYGYLELGDALEDDVLRVLAFVEKPPLERAVEYLRAGNYAWNAGMFVWRTDVFRRALQAATPELAGVSRANYESMPSISIDHALLEKARRVAAVRGDFEWSDVGSFETLERLGVVLPPGIRGSV